MKITKADKRRFKLYNKKNKLGAWKYRLSDIARIEGISRQAVNRSLMKFEERELRK